VLPRFLALPDGSFFLLGPRGTGKTTWLRRRLPEALWVNLLDPGEYRELSAYPERLRELVEGAPTSQRDASCAFRSAPSFGVLLVRVVDSIKGEARNVESIK
jgi:hypothetical protein